jgi:hypothetical protein
MAEKTIAVRMSERNGHNQYDKDRHEERGGNPLQYQLQKKTDSVDAKRLK